MLRRITVVPRKSVRDGAGNGVNGHPRPTVIRSGPADRSRVATVAAVDTVREQGFVPAPPTGVWRLITETGPLCEWYSPGGAGVEDGTTVVVTEEREHHAHPDMSALAWRNALRAIAEPAG